MNLLDRKCFTRFFIFAATMALVLSFFCRKGAAQEKTPVDQPPVTAETLTKESVGEKLSATRKKLDAISPDVGKDSPEGVSRSALQRQVELFEQLLGIVAKAEAQAAQKAAIEDRLRNANDQLAALSAKGAPQPPATVDKKGFESFNAGVDQDKRLATEKEELAGIRELLKQAGASRRAADRIKLTLQQLKLRRRLLTRPFRPGFSQTLNGFRDRRFTIEDTLFSIRDRWKESVEAALVRGIGNRSAGGSG